MPHIQVPEDSSNARVVHVVGATPVSTFAFSFPFFATADIKVYKDGAAVSSGITVAGTGGAVDGGYSSGSVTFSVAQSNCTIVIERDVALSRTDDFPYPSPVFNIKVLNTSLDRVFAIFQQFRRLFARALLQPVGDTTAIGELPAAAVRAGKMMGFDSNGAVIAVSAGTLALGPGDVTGDKIAAGAVSGGKLAANAVGLDKLARSGTAGQVLTSGGPGADPSYQAPAGVPVGTLVPTAAIVAPSGWSFANGQAVSRTTFAALFAALSTASTVTVSIASPGVVTWNAHGRSNGDILRFATTGALPTGLVANTNYFIVNQTTNTFQLAATRGGAAINTSGAQSGVQTARFAPHGHGDGSTTFNLPDMRGRVAAGCDNMGGTAANRLTTAGSGISGVNLGDAGGTETHTLTTAQLASHQHTVPYAPGGSPGGGSGCGGGTGNTGSAGSGNAHQNTQPTVVLNYIIKE